MKNDINLYDERDYEIKIIISTENNVYIEKNNELIFLDDITNLDYSMVEVVKEIITIMKGEKK